MYSMSPGLGAVPRQIRPPAWLRSIAGAVVRGTQVSVPTPAGPQVFDLSKPLDKAALQRLADQATAMLRQMASGTTVSVTRRPNDQGDYVSRNIPGGWATVIGGGLALLVLPKLIGGRR